MKKVTLSVSEGERAWIERRVAEGGYHDVGGFFCDRIRRDLDGSLPGFKESKE